MVHALIIALWKCGNQMLSIGRPHKPIERVSECEQLVQRYTSFGMNFINPFHETTCTLQCLILTKIRHLNTALNHMTLIKSKNSSNFILF
jgi:hypothetical protein